jgi:hypothetical protein
MYALQEFLSYAENNHPSRSDEISKIKKALEYVEDTKNHVRKFEVLEEPMGGFINDAHSKPSNPQNEDWLNIVIIIKGPLLNTGMHMPIMRPILTNHSTQPFLHVDWI